MANSVAQRYAAEMRKNFGGYYATWDPGRPLQLGDYGTLKFRKITYKNSCTKWCYAFVSIDGFTQKFFRNKKG